MDPCEWKATLPSWIRKARSSVWVDAQRSPCAVAVTPLILLFATAHTSAPALSRRSRRAIYLQNLKKQLTQSKLRLSQDETLSTSRPQLPKATLTLWIHSR